MDYVETEGSSIDEAINNALKALGAERAKVEIEILSNATRGLFGIGGKKARVRATLRRPLDAATVSARPEKRRSQGSEETEVEARAAVPPSAALPPVSAPQPRRQPDAPKPTGQARPPSALQAAPAAALTPGAIERARTVLDEIVRLMGYPAEIEVAQAHDDDLVVLGLRGESSGVLIGRRGQTLDALEYLVNRIVSREDEKSARLSVDCERYREKRRRSLEELALRMADRAKRRHKPVTLNPMSPRDRRIVHLALQGDPSLTTRSAGKGYFRKLLIIPEADRRTKVRPADSN